MTVQHILSIDPGKSSGIALGTFNDTEPYSLVNTWQFGGGLIGLRGWVVSRAFYDSYSDGEWVGKGIPGGVTTICEKFTPLQNTGFNLTLDSVEPLRGEGYLVGVGLMPDYPDPVWRRPNEMYLYGGKTLPEKKKRAYKFLKDNGMHLTGKTVGQPDAFDARSATLHGISYVMKVLGHKPTYQMVSEWNEENS